MKNEVVRTCEVLIVSMGICTGAINGAVASAAISCGRWWYLLGMVPVSVAYVLGLRWLVNKKFEVLDRMGNQE